LVLSLIAAAPLCTFAQTTSASTTPQPPPVPECYYQGSGFGSCEGIVLPTPGVVIKFTHPGKGGIFRLSGPSPLQTKKAVACGDAGCVFNHLDWAVYARVVSGCAPNTTECVVRVPPGPTWTPVYVRQNNNPAILWLLWNSGRPGGVIKGTVLRPAGAAAPGGAATPPTGEEGVAGAMVTADGPKGGGTSAVDPTSGFYSINVPVGTYRVSPSGGPAGSRFIPKNTSVSVGSGATVKANFALEQIELSGTIELGCSTSCSAGGPVPVSGITVEVKGKTPGSAITDDSGKWTMQVSAGAYTIVPSTAGFTYSPDSRSVDVKSSIEGQNFTACGAQSAAATPAVVNAHLSAAASSTWVLTASTCNNFVYVMYSPVTNAATVSWNAKSFFCPGHGAVKAHADASLGGPLLTEHPVGTFPGEDVHRFKTGNVGIVVNNSDGVHAMLIDIVNGGQSGTVKLFGAAYSRVNAGTTENCSPFSAAKAGLPLKVPGA
jgi:hypothetical protein